MKIAFLGDSITEGYGASSRELCYVNRVGKTLNCEVLNYGIGGTRIARQTKNSFYAGCDVDFNLRIPLLDKTADKIFVFGGVNDFLHGCAPLGEKGDFDYYTFNGAVNKLFATLIDMYGKQNVIVILPLKVFDLSNRVNEATGMHLIDYVNAIKYYVDYYGLKCINLYDDGLPEPQTCGECELFLDGVHPNDKGYEIVAEKICEFIKNDK